MGGKKEKARIERSAGGVVVSEDPEGVRVLLIRDPYGKWGLPKGHLEEGEGPEAAAVREVEEETGLRELDFGPRVGSIDWYFRADGKLIHKFCEFFLLRSTGGDLRPEVEEGITECIWLSFPKALETITYENAREMVVAAEKILRGEKEPLWKSPFETKA